MKLLPQSPTAAIPAWYQREKVTPELFNAFLKALDNYFYYTERAKRVGETETFEQYLADFLTACFPDVLEKKDYAHLKTAVWQIDEQALICLVPNDFALPTAQKPNTKALQILSLVFFIENILCKNQGFTYLVLTNAEDFLLFDALDFQRFFYANEALKQEIAAWQSIETTPDITPILNEIKKAIQKYFTKENENLSAVAFNLCDFQTDLNDWKATKNEVAEVDFSESVALKNTKKKAERRLIEIYKLFSPLFLLKKTPKNTAQKLNENFYKELLHLLGLEEHRPKNRNTSPTIGRCRVKNPASLLEQTLNALQEGKLSPQLRSERISLGSQIDETPYLDFAQTLVITWFCRILFLKLLEGQLLSYNSDDFDRAAFRFLEPSKIPNFQALNTLFFEVLAVPEKERRADVIKNYNRLPYLNSSLFEVTELEQQSLLISDLNSDLLMPIHAESILNTTSNENCLTRDNQVVSLPFLSYLLNFLDAYDFGAAASETMLQTHTKPLMNTAALGLVLEKISGNGVAVTPSATTFQLSRELLKRLILDKFNDPQAGFNLAASDFEDVRRFCESATPHEKTKANALLNRLTICDPSVGSGRLLVAVLQQLLVLKSDLNLLFDADGQPLDNISLSFNGHELVIYDKTGVPFQYEVSFETGLRRLIPEKQRIQEAIFYEKKHLIEHCLFGIDIDQKAVQICRLRLWAELLQSTFYKQRRNTQLETLPNIDINIKMGNALVSRFDLTADLDEVFRHTHYSVENYKNTVRAYKIEADKAQKRLLAGYLNEIKSEFQITFDKRERDKIAKARGKKEALALQIENNRKLGYKATKTELDTLNKYAFSLQRREAERDEILATDRYRDAFEWRFEFPEVLDENGNFVGFDAVINHAPSGSPTPIEKLYFRRVFETAKGNFELHHLLFERAVRILNDSGKALQLLTVKAWQQRNTKILHVFLDAQGEVTFVPLIEQERVGVLVSKNR